MGKVNDCTCTTGQLVAPAQAPEPGHGRLRECSASACEPALAARDVLALVLLCDLQRARGGDRVIMWVIFAATAETLAERRRGRAGGEVRTGKRALMQSSAKRYVHQQFSIVRQRTHTDPQTLPPLLHREHCTSRTQPHVKKLAAAAQTVTARAIH